MRADPPVRADGLCALPGCEKRRQLYPPKTMPKTLRPAFQTALDVEPFCSSDHCRAWHDNERPASPTSHGRRHGFESTYRAGCRCDRCTEAAVEGRNRRRIAETMRQDAA